MGLKDGNVVKNKKGVKDSIDVLGVTYKIKTVLVEDGDAGFCEHKNRIIYLNADMHYGVYLETLWHEIVHTIMDRCGLCESLNDRQTEMLAEAFGCMLPTIMNKNKWLIGLSNE